MSSKRYTDEFKIEAVRQVTDRGFKVAEVAERLGVTTHSLYAWIRTFGKPEVVQRAELDQSAEIRRLKWELLSRKQDCDIQDLRGLGPGEGPFRQVMSPLWT